MSLDKFNYDCDGQLDINQYLQDSYQLTHLSLFTGIGGLDLAAECAGFKTVGQCEFAEYPTKVLEKHWPDVPRWKDIRTLTGDSFYERTGRRTVDIISGGFPCQPFSVAGKRRGKEDDRFLWPEMVRVIKELRPTWVVGENVAGIVNMELGNILSDLETEGYKTRAFLIPAHAVGAPHRRYRTAIVGYTEHNGLHAPEVRRGIETPSGRKQEGEKTSSKLTGTSKRKNSETMGNSNSSGSRTCRDGTYGKVTEEDEGWWAVEPDVGRVANGISNRVDRIKCLGNAVVPQQFYPIFKAIAEIEVIN